MNIKDRISSDCELQVIDAGLIPCSGNITITLPVAAGNKGLEYFVKKTDYENNVRILAAGEEMIDGVPWVELSIEGQVLRVVSDGSNWLKL